MSTTDKDTIYIDIDDEITSIIEKVRDSEHKILALVLPKRAATLQSIVNMKLLKRTADSAKKSIVLITSEASLLPLAGAVGLHVAKTLQSKPAIPPPPDMSKTEEPLIAEDVEADDEPEIDESKSVGELAGLPEEPKAAAEETIDIDNSDTEEEAKPSKKKSKNKSKIKIPDFNKFRLRLILGGVGLIGLIFLWYLMFHVLPKTTIAIQTNNQNFNASPSVTVNSGVKAVDVPNKIVPATMKDDKITATQKATATGKKNTGNKASGSVQFYNCNENDTLLGTDRVVPAGTGITSNGLTYITQQAVNVPPSNFNPDHTCKGNKASSSVNVIAQQGGTNYNSSQSTNYSVAGYTTITAAGSSMTGGTDQNVTVLSQSDIDGAKQKIASNTTQAQNDLVKAFKTAGYLPITATLVSDDPTVSTSANAGDQVSEVSVTVVTTYHMLGAKQADLEKLVADSIKGQIDAKKQEVSDYGLAAASYTLTDKKSNTEQVVTVKTTVVTGAQIDVNGLKKQVEGKKEGDIRQMIEALPSVKKVTIQYSPFWVSSAPHKTSRITITVENISSSNDK